MTILPLGNRALIREADKAKVSAGGIVIPDNVKDGNYSTTATVIAVGRGKILENGQLIEPIIKKGDTIILGKHHGTVVTYEGKEHRIVDMDMIEGKTEE